MSKVKHLLLFFNKLNITILCKKFLRNIQLSRAIMKDFGEEVKKCFATEKQVI